jgi:hypothetical protein
MPSRDFVNIIAHYVEIGSIIHTIFSHINQKYVGDMSQKNYDDLAGDAQGNPNSKERKLGRSWPAWKGIPGPLPHVACDI